MPKLTKDYPEHINFLARSGTLATVAAIALQRGDRDKSAPLRDALEGFIQSYLSGLSPKERREYEQILANVQTERAMREAIKRDRGHAPPSG